MEVLRLTQGPPKNQLQCPEEQRECPYSRKDPGDQQRVIPTLSLHACQLPKAQPRDSPLCHPCHGAAVAPGLCTLTAAGCWPRPPSSYTRRKALPACNEPVTYSCWKKTKWGLLHHNMLHFLFSFPSLLPSRKL